MPSNFTELMVCMWCLPMTMFILLPLLILAGWSAKTLFVSR